MYIFVSLRTLNESPTCSLGFSMTKFRELAVERSRISDKEIVFKIETINSETSVSCVCVVHVFLCVEAGSQLQMLFLRSHKC